MSEQVRMWIGGAWVDAADGAAALRRIAFAIEARRELCDRLARIDARG